MGPTPTTDNFLKPSILIVVFIFLSSFVASAIGSEVVAFFLIWGPALVYLFVKYPVYTIARVLLLLGLVVESPSDRPGNGYWVPPFAPLNKVLFGGLNKWLGLPGGSFHLFIVLAVILLVLARKANRNPSSKPSLESRSSIQLYLYGIAISVVWGLLRGGRLQPMFWQILPILVAVTTCLAFLWSFRGKQDLHAVGTIVVVAAITKGLIVFWVYMFICRPLNIKPFYATTHSDSVTFACAFAVLLNRAFEERSKTSIRYLLGITPLLLMFVYMNNRRLAFVSFAATLFLAVLYLKSKKLKRKLLVIALACSPLVATYFVVGANSDLPVFALAKALDSVSSSKDNSSATRDIENYNLHITLKRALIGGTGFGHEYVEQVVAYDISASHALYRYIPHNSVLWILSVGGLLFFWMLWFPYAMTSFLAFRAYRIVDSPFERAAALTTSCIVFVYMLQSWGDMAISTDTPGILFAIGFSIVAKLDNRTKRSTQSGSPIGKSRQSIPV